MSFVSQFGGNQETGKHTGMGGINAALAAGMTINEIRNQLAREGVQTGSKATEFLAARPATSFIAQYGGNEETMGHSGLTALNRAQAAGLSLGQIRSQAAAEGIQFGERAANVLRQDETIQSITDSFTQQIAELNRDREQDLAQMQRQFKIESERMRREQQKQMMEQQKAAQVQMANAARAGVEGELKLGAGRTGRGVEAFKRRLKITPSTAQGLAISTANKPAGALNV
jgi:DNA-binding transcriptional MerR regulator